MIPRFRPVLGLEEALCVFRAGTDETIAFETAFAEKVGQRFAVAFPYGRTGLLVLLKCLGLRNADVVCPAYTCVVVPHAVVLSGNRPKFIDSGHDANMRLDLAEQSIGANTGAMIATSIFGHSVDLDALRSMQRRHPDLPIIQDCAHSFICEWRNEPVHRFGKAAVFGLNASKMMTSIFGGMVTTDDPALAERLIAERARSVSAPAWSKALARSLYLLALYPAFYPPLYGLTETLRQLGALDRFTRYYDESEIDMPADYLTGITDVEARVGQVQTRRLDGFIAAHRQYAQFYRSELEHLPTLGWLDAPEGSSFSHIAVRVADKNSVMKKAAKSGVQLGEVIEYSIPEMKAYKAMAGGHAFPVSGALARQTVNLPVSGRFDPRIAERVVRVLADVLGNEPAVGRLDSPAG